YGVRCLDHLNGMFGLALLDRRRRRLLLARDPMGMKPLYYAATPRGIVFASEAKALLACGLVQAEADWEALNIYFAGSYIPAPMTCFQSIRRLRPGEFLLAEG